MSGSPCPWCGKWLADGSADCPDCGPMAPAVAPAAPAPIARPRPRPAWIGWTLVVAGIAAGFLVFFDVVLGISARHRAGLTLGGDPVAAAPPPPAPSPPPPPPRPPGPIIPDHPIVAVGDFAALASPDPDVSLRIADDRYPDAWDRMVEATKARDDVGLGGLVATGRVFTVERGTRAQVIDRGFTSSKVRICEGPEVGRVGWLDDQSAWPTR